MPVSARRQRQVGDEVEPVARGDDDAVHGRELHLLELRSRREQGRDLSGAPVEQVPGIGTIRTYRADDPERVVVRLAPDLNGRIELTLEHRKVAPGGGIDGDPRAAYVLGRDSGHLVGARVSHPPRDVDFLVARDQHLGAGGPVDPQHHGLVAADGAAQEPGVLRRD